MERSLFGNGNAKMGKVLTWSIPAIKTCPGRSKLCESLCYATQGFFHMRNVEEKLHWAWQQSKQPNFHLKVVKALADKKEGQKFRIHVAGDFYDVDYAKKWLYIIKNSPHIRFWWYSRSWRIPEIRKVLEKIAKLPNSFGWYSVDQETGQPKHIKAGIRTAYMMVDDADVPGYKPDLYFRDYDARKTTMKHVGGQIVCPAENGVSGHVQCDKCQICLSDAPNKRTNNRSFKTIPTKRIALPLVTV